MPFNLQAGLTCVALLVTPLASGNGLDLHQLWDDRCHDCHGHAGDFAREFLKPAAGELQGRHHVHDLRRFLHNHYLLESEVDAVYAMLLAQAGTPPRFQQECSRCHDSAAEFVRQSLELRNGVLYARNSNQPLRDFLQQHRKLSVADVEFFTRELTRIAGEVYRP